MQRHKCRSCGKRFQRTSQTPVHGELSEERLSKLRTYVHCMRMELTVRKTAEVCGINPVTAFRWRHKIFDALALTMENACLQEVVEGEAFFVSLRDSRDRAVGEAVGRESAGAVR